MKIGLFGLFGCGNSGNDASLEAMVLFLRRACPDAELTCICPAPDVVRQGLGVDAIASNPPIYGSRLGLAFDRVLLHIPRRVAGILHAFLLVRTFDIIIVPGTGFLDDFSDTPFGWPFGVLKWLGSAWLARRKVLLVSIGAGPIRHWLSRFFMKAAARTASYRSYRDKASKTFMTKLGIDTRADEVYPDIVFSLPVPKQEKREHDPLTIGVGVMSYFGWAPAGDADATIYRPYLRKLDEFISWLLERGYNIRLLTGDGGDWKAIEDLKAEMIALHPDRVLSEERITAVRGSTLQDVMADIARTDVTVVTRYHNLVCSLKLSRPVVSLEYSTKNHALMADAGLDEFCQHVETFDVEALKAQFVWLIERRAELTDRIAVHDVELRRRLAVQEDILLDIIRGEAVRSRTQLQTATN
ncbi:polysaccharide pyruvyl transferase family protein [Rhizobium sp. BK251]|uniref:polysaccharide pyruvyl transferase family protein n=1 Tax=Rhizobium sp. BK251 TaxID=2512125 RepID=UPI00104F89B5|nr:polysaccharide pyruvyl transferase family protein [Rhizobium sp. BK251]TCL74564.1 polysaccharide pyruvyl transferase WcaK-like protein [Rhizobium sp. BK251]